jgi:hypothetical protein
MLELGPATNDEVVLAFLQAEIESPEHGPHIVDLLNRLCYDRSVLIDNADLSDAHANCARAVILGVRRGYGRNEVLFHGFPSDSKWRRVLLDLNDIGRLKYIGIQAFIDLSGGTRLAAEGACNYKNNPETAKKVVQILEKISRGVSFPELVLVEDARKQLVIIEGNHRVTAYVVAGVAETRALIGTSPTMDQWPFI